MRNSMRIVLFAAALPMVAVLSTGSASAACGDGWNVDARGRCFPAWMGTGVYTGRYPQYYGRDYGRGYYRENPRLYNWAPPGHRKHWRGYRD